jgi:hypothetical protein
MTDRKSWDEIRKLSDDDLYAMLGSEPSYFEPSSTPEHLILGFKFPKDAGAIKAGRERVSSVLSAYRAKICERWRSFRRLEQACRSLRSLYWYMK